MNTFFTEMNSQSYGDGEDRNDCCGPDEVFLEDRREVGGGEEANDQHASDTEVPYEGPQAGDCDGDKVHLRHHAFLGAGAGAFGAAR
jgi:hypothetical protein